MVKINTETIIEKYLVDKTNYGNIRLKVIREEDNLILVFQKSCYDYETMTRKRIFIPAKYILMKKLEDNCYEMIEEFECEKRRIDFPYRLILKLRELRMD